MNEQKTILVTNDDGYQSAGIKALVDSLRGLGRIIVVAPDSVRSGFSASFTYQKPVTLTRISDDGEVSVYACSGTPVDCVKLGLHRFFENRKPDLIVSGINHGGNDSICIMYSGTMGAALEGAVVQVPSIGFSLLDFRPDADFSVAHLYTRSISEKVLKDGLPHGVALNVNIPVGEIEGVRVCRQADGFWQKEFLFLDGNEDTDAAHFQVVGEYVNREPEATDTDRYWLDHHHISVVPVSVDYTSSQHVKKLGEVYDMLKVKR